MTQETEKKFLERAERSGKKRACEGRAAESGLEGIDSPPVSEERAAGKRRINPRKGARRAVPEAASLPLVRREPERDGAEAGVQSGGACGDRLNDDRSEGRSAATEGQKKNPREGG